MTPNIAKLLETLMLEEIEHVMLKNEVHNPFQYGFFTGSSTTIKLVDVFYFIGIFFALKMRTMYHWYSSISKMHSITYRTNLF